MGTLQNKSGVSDERFWELPARALVLRYSDSGNKIANRLALRQVRQSICLLIIIVSNVFEVFIFWVYRE